MELKDRLNADTPKWFGRIIKIGLSIAATGTVLLTASETVPGFTLPSMMEQVAQWMVIAGLVASAISKTAKEDSQS